MRNTIFKITAAYLVFGFFWIYATDKLVQIFPPEIEDTLQTYKGLAFVALTTATLFGLLTYFRVSLENKEKERLEEAEAKMKLAEENKHLQTFNYTVSHDLKSPLRVISGYASLLISKHKDNFDEEDKEIVQHLQQAIKNSDKLINELLLYSQLNEKEIRAEKVDMNTLFEDALQNSRKVYQQQVYAIDCSDLPAVSGDNSMLAHVVSNLVSNAFKYSACMPQPRISIGCRYDLGQYIFYVKDNGVGFDMQYAGKLFKPFQRLHGSEIEGHGVGLAIVERILTKHKGKIWAESNPGQGATFYFTLPQSVA